MMKNTEPIELRQFSKDTGLPIEKLLDFFDQEFDGYINYILACHNDIENVDKVLEKLYAEHGVG